MIELGASSKMQDTKYLLTENARNVYMTANKVLEQ